MLGDPGRLCPILGPAPRPGAVRRSQIPRQFLAFRLRRSQRAQGRQRQIRRHRHLRHAQPLHPEGPDGGGSGRDVRHADDPLRGRARLVLWTHRRERGGGARQGVGRLYLAQRGAFLGRQPDFARGRGLDLRHAQGQGPSALAALLRRRAQGRKDRPAPGEVHLPQRRQPRAARDRRRDAGSVQGLLEQKRFLQDDARQADGQRTLQDRIRRARPQRDLSPGAGLLGQGSAGQPRAQQFRNHPLRLLPRPGRFARSLQGRRLRHKGRERLQELGHRL